MAQDRKTLRPKIQTAQNIVGEVRCLHRAQRTLKDSTHPSHSLFTLLPPGKDTEVFAAVPPDYRAAFFHAMWDSAAHYEQFTVMIIHYIITYI